MDANRSRVSAIAIAAGRVVFVGSDAQADELLGPSTRVLDLQGQMVLPGLHDSHVHLCEGGLATLQCSLAGLTTVQQVLDKVAAYAAEHPELTWIIGGGWEATLFPPEGPTHQILDAVVSDRPVVLYGGDGHSAWLNAEALRLARITRDTPDPPNGRIERDAAGEPTGTLRESAVDLAVAAAPPVSRQEYADGLRAGLRLANSLGITSIFEANATPGVLQAYQDLDQSDELTVRVLAALETRPLEGPEQVARMVQARERSRGRRLRPDAAKIFVDGVIEAQTAALLEPYVGSSESGPLNFTPTALNALVKALDEAGFVVHFHAIGDRAVRVALDSVEALGGTSLRPSVAHLELTDPADLPRIDELGCVANIQPRWAILDEDIRDLTAPVLGPVRSSRLYAFGSMRDAGALLAGGSDWPVSGLAPLEGVQVGVTRRALNAGPGEAWLPEQLLTLDQVLASYTIGGAFAQLQEEQAGSLEVGKLADLVVLERDLFEVATDQLSQVRILRTFVEGEEVYSAELAGRGSSSAVSPALILATSARISGSDACCATLARSASTRGSSKALSARIRAR